MLLSKINSLFTKMMTLEGFKKEIENETSEYKKSLEKKGGSSPIYLNEDLEGILIREEDIKFLCDAFLLNRLDKWELNYITEGIMLSEKTTFNNDKVEDALLALTDPEYFKLINTEFIRSILEDMYI